MNKPIIEEKLKVFVSSAMGNEPDTKSNDEFVWLDFRQKVKDELNRCPYIQAFTIEDHASEFPSNDFMKYEVSISDVVVLLVKDEFRSGTSIEYILCRQTNKPLLIFFFSDENAKSEVLSLKEDLIGSDYCTFREMKDFINSEKIIANEVIQNVICYYKYKHFVSPTVSNANIVEVSEETILSDITYIPSKSVLSKFKTCYKLIYKYLGFSDTENINDVKEKSELHQIGEQVIKWVINGENFLTFNVKELLTSSISIIYPKTDWFVKRLDAIDYYIQGNVIQAFQSEKEALHLAEKHNAADWVLNNILIDIRNLQYYCPSDIVLQEGDEYQKRLNNLDYIVHVPVLDRYLNNIYQKILSEENKLYTAYMGTTFFGNEIDNIISGVENYLFLSLLYGSYTHLMLTRNIFASIFYRVGKLYGENNLLYSAVKMYLLAGDYKEFQRLCDFEWSNISSIMISRADELWNQASNLLEKSKDNICVNLIFRVGLYLSDRPFDDVEKYLINLSSSLPPSLSKDYLDCLLQNCGRMHQGNVVKIVITIIKNHSFANANKLTQIICCLDFAGVQNNLLVELCEVMKTNMTSIINCNGDPQCIAVLVNFNPEIFSALKTIPNNGLVGEQKLYYALNTGEGDWKDVLLSELQSAEQHFLYAQNGTYIGHAIEPFNIISLIFDVPLSSEIIEIINQKLFPLCIRVLESDCYFEYKDQCAECLCISLGYFKKNGIEIPDELIKCISSVSLTNDPDFSISIRSSEGLWCRIITLKIIAGVLDKEVLIQWCFSYSKKEAKERYALVQCLKTYLQFSPDLKKDVDALIVSIVFQCCEDQEVIIRQTACDCLWHILESPYADYSEEKLYEMAIDPAPTIKFRLLHFCEEDVQRYKSIKNKIIVSLVNDSHYLIRKKAKQLLEKSLEM